MVKSDSVYLEDIAQAIAKIERYIQGITFEVLVSDELRHDAIIRQLEILGEAANRLSLEFTTNHPNFPVKQAISMRNFLIHGYDDIDLTVVWKTIQEDLPLVKQSLQAIKNSQ